MTNGPLHGVLVVDLSRALAGPHAAMMLGDLGARVIKVEHPDGGDDTRGWGPPFVGPEDARESTYFLSCNRNKESVRLDLKSEDGWRLLTRLVERADVLVENFRPGVLDRLGFSFARLHELNPRLVILSITGFGHDGPEGGRAGYDQILQGEAGLMSLTGPGPDQPTRIGVPIGDLLAGMYGAYGVVAALYERARTGRGKVVRTSLLAAIVGVHAFQGTKYTVAGQVGRAQGNLHPSLQPYGTYRCKDGVIQVAVGSEGLWARFAPLIGLAPDDPRFATNAQRVERVAELTEVIERAFAARTVAELLAELLEAGVPAGEVRTLDRVYTWEQTRSQGLVIEVDHATLGRVQLPGPPLRFQDTDGREQRFDHQAPPTLGQHDAAVREWLGES
ncbi:CoA transferase [Carbonactinospora thermoautotrophica]|uniref:CoA-transferase n=1 Tax=Carbonactinospora thermoautotrophica TaxID=1469144 RepID=A0A132NBU3_9ACTN|nr:CoA transferase [Carbonactinospora thermoautotrophica]KWX00789.1 L-carnitine dehydratase/bile acid-inducible protein F [Carbonactinospora thermoautotrophica]KWX05260.1 CoA-transferase [Carbonactinospora thermoautotrophica]KWX07615.1 CoA-transferase [Carbonactinospora thermoautotrophica]MCX9192943.1 CoA transferase [Carbonactinospora thermoautotrophica]